jgi:error-prone DNA polymerase
VTGEVQRSPEGVMHLMANHIADHSAALDHLSRIHSADTPLARASEDLVHGPSSHPGRRTGHPRNVRILPRSRDFH